MSRPYFKVVAPAVTLAATLVAWWLVTTVLVAPHDVLRRFNPSDGAQALWRITTTGEIWPHISATIFRLVVGLGVASVAGVVVGLVLGWWRSLEIAFGPLIQLIRMISPLAWTPIVIIVFGIGDRPVQVLVILAAIWPMVLNTSAGVRSLDVGWLLVARNLGAKRLELLRFVVLPGIASHVTTGLRLALGVSWIVVVPAEMLGVHSGLGYFILDCRDRLAYDELVATILVIGAIGTFFDLAIRLVLERVTGEGSPNLVRPHPKLHQEI